MNFIGLASFIFASFSIWLPEIPYKVRSLFNHEYYVSLTYCHDKNGEGFRDRGRLDLGKIEEPADYEKFKDQSRIIRRPLDLYLTENIDGKNGFPVEAGKSFIIQKIFSSECSGEKHEGKIKYLARGLLKD